MLPPTASALPRGAPSSPLLAATPFLQLNIANPSNGAMKVVEIDDEKKLVQLYEKRMAQEVVGDVLGDEYKGYIFRCGGEWLVVHEEWYYSCAFCE